MIEDLKKGLLAVCELLQRFEVRYMLVGGSSVALHGYYRHSMGPSGNLAAKPDIDLWFDPSYENYFNLLKTLEALNYDVSEFRNESQPDQDVRSSSSIWANSHWMHFHSSMRTFLSPTPMPGKRKLNLMG